MLSKWKWGRHKNGYAYRSARSKTPGKKWAKIYMHRVVIGEIPAGLEVDHINLNRLDNRRENLRTCTHAENLATRETRNQWTGKNPEIALWPTARASNAGPDYAIHDRPDSGGESLVTKLAAAMWPTPNTPNGTRGMSLEDIKANGNTPRGKRQVSLEAVCRIALWPTACAANWRSGKVTQETLESNSRPLQEILVSAYGQTSPGSNAETASGGAPNPEFVAWLQGVPWGYLKHWEIQSSGQLPLL
jgi:hypothetical protein